jgi:hypothetical protein
MAVPAEVRVKMVDNAKKRVGRYIARRENEADCAGKHLDKNLTYVWVFVVRVAILMPPIACC